VKVSIVTISYNQAEFLERAIQSVIQQNYDNIEYIVVDPGSTDNSREIIERYRSRITKVIYEPDKGPADGLNKGFSHASGDIFGFLNSDDILFPGAVARIVSYLSDHPDVDVVSGHAIIIDEQDREIRKSYSDRFSLIRYAYGTGVLIQPSTFFKSETYKKTRGFNVDNRTNWDGELFVDMRMQGARFSLMDDFLSGYRLQSNSITASKKLDDGIKNYRKRIFRRIMGRDIKPRDNALSVLFRLEKYAANPRALYERIFHGPIYGRNAGQPGSTERTS
jgi:glycosyltransferase involved in cell wall biosynthesis